MLNYAPELKSKCMVAVVCWIGRAGNRYLPEQKMLLMRAAERKIKTI